MPALNQIEWHPKCHDESIRKYCEENKILVQAYSSLGTSSDSSLRNDPTIVAIAKKLDKSPEQVMLRFATQKGVAVIPKARSKKHLEANFNLDFTIPDDVMQVLNNFNHDERIDWDPNGVV